MQIHFFGQGFDEIVLTHESFPMSVTFDQARVLGIGVGFQAGISAIVLNFQFPILEDLKIIGIKFTKPVILKLSAGVTFAFSLTTLQ